MNNGCADAGARRPRNGRDSRPSARRGRAGRGPRQLSRALILAASALFPFTHSAPAHCRFERTALTARASAAGAATVSYADGADALFVNPAGLASIGGLEAYADYAEPASAPFARETRVALGGNAGFARFGLGWYRRAGDAAGEDCVAAGAARTLVAGTQGSYIAVGAAAVAGRTTGAAPGLGAGGGWTPVGADLGIIVRPLPVVSFGYAAGNVFDRGGDAGDGERWGRTCRWGFSYFWENAIVLSFARSTHAGTTSRHFGFSARAAVPVELMFGLSDGRATGGVRWTGARLRASVAFAAEEPSGVTWMVSCEGTIFASREGEWR